MGRSYLRPPDKGIRQVLFASRERDGVPSPFVFNWSWLVAGSLDADQVSLSFHRHLLQDCADQRTDSRIVKADGNTSTTPKRGIMSLEGRPAGWD